METKVNYARVGLFVVLLGAALVAVFTMFAYGRLRSER